MSQCSSMSCRIMAYTRAWVVLVLALRSNWPSSRTETAGPPGRWSEWSLCHDVVVNSHRTLRTLNSQVASRTPHLACRTADAHRNQRGGAIARGAATAGIGLDWNVASMVVPSVSKHVQ
jgi:hypothetical protein